MNTFYILKLFRRLISGTLFILLIVSCNNPYAGIGEKLDSSSWIDIDGEGGFPFARTFDNGRGIELLIMEGDILSNSNFGSVSIIRVSTADLPVDSVPRQDIQVLQGSYIINTSNIRFDLKKMYTLSFQDTGGGIVTDSSQNEIDLEETHAFSGFSRNSAPNTMEISFSDSSATFVFKRMDIIIDDIMTNSVYSASQRAANIHKLYQISGIFAPQSRISGFGGADMLKYTTKTNFSSLLNNEEGSHYMSIQLRQTLKATTTFSFNDACDLKPFRLNGEYVSVASMSGSGPLSGVVSFTMQGSSQTWNCSLNYDDIEVTNTVASSGSYSLSIDGDDALSIPFDNTNPGVLDFSTIQSIPESP